MNQLITDNIDVWTSTVKTKSASGRGSSKKRELYGVKKLRELILELAVRGKLVPQDPTDEPAAVLLERIAEDKAQLVKDKKIKKPKNLPEISDEEKSFVLPVGWEWAHLQDLTTYVQRGKGPNYAESGSVQVVSQKCVQNSGFDLSPARYVTDESLEKYQEERYLQDNDILWNSTGTGTVGRANVITNIPEKRIVADSHVTVIRPTNFYSRFLWCFIMAPGVQARIQPDHENALVSGSTKQVELNTSSVVSVIVPVAPLKEQHRIVAKVDDLMTLCDQLEQQTEASIEAHQVLVTTLLDTLTNSADTDELMQNWARISEHFDTLFTTEASIDQLKQTILQLAVMGKLVPQDPNDELQPNDLVTVVKKLRTISSLAKNTGKVDLNTFEFFSEKLALPSNWTVHPLAEIVLAVVDCPHSTPKWTDNGEICVRTTQMAPFSLDLSTSRYVSSDTYLKRIERLKPESDDVLYSREGGILGVACRVPSGVELCLGQRMIVIRPSRLITSRFLELVLNSPLVNEIARHNTTGGAAPRVNVNVIKGYPIPLPPLEEQNRVITKVDELFSVCDALKVRLKDSQTTQLHLTDAIVEQAV
ncbi:restriction endonuclease subunit S [Vibrio sp. 10N.237.312.C02]